jgi:mRNA-degrading endonuclease RelE of RelBE toxin-antitoxin system
LAGIRKARAENPTKGKGKRGGFRYVYYFLERDDEICLLFLFDKGEQEDLDEKQKATLRTMVAELKGVNNAKENPDFRRTDGRFPRCHCSEKGPQGRAPGYGNSPRQAHASTADQENTTGSRRQPIRLCVYPKCQPQSRSELGTRRTSANEHSPQTSEHCAKQSANSFAARDRISFSCRAPGNPEISCRPIVTRLLPPRFVGESSFQHILYADGLFSKHKLKELILAAVASPLGI